MLSSELKTMSIFKPEGEFSPEFNFSDYSLVKDENHMVIDIKWNDFILNKTAEEVYQAYLSNKDKHAKPTIEERIKSTEDTLLMLMDMQMGGI